MSKILSPNFDAWRGINAWSETSVTPANRLVDMRFGQVVPTSDYYSARQCAVNRARARTDPIETAIVGGFNPAAVSTDYISINNATDYYEYQGITEPAEFTIYAIFKTPSTTLGDTSNNRFCVCGWFGAALENGAILMSYDETHIRGLGYQTNDSLLSNQITLSGTTSADWALIGFRARSTGGTWGFGGFQAVNLTTMASPATETPVTTARQLGTRNFRIGKPYQTYFLETGHVAAVRLDNVWHDDTQMAAVAAEYRARFTGSSVTF